MLAGTVPAARYPGSVGAMILEHALITVRPDSHEEFEAALVRAREVISAAPGFLSLRLSRGIESPDEWRSQIGPFFDSPPVVDHYTPVLA